MKFSETLFEQYNKFFVFIGFGFVLGVVYDIFLFLRSLLSDKKIAWIIQDVLFGFTATISTFLMLLAYSNGEIRVNLIVSCAIGFAVYKLSMGKIVGMILDKCNMFIKTVSNFLLKPFKAVCAVIERLSERLKHMLANAADKVKNIKSKRKNVPKKKRKKLVSKKLIKSKKGVAK